MLNTVNYLTCAGCWLDEPPIANHDTSPRELPEPEVENKLTRLDCRMNSDHEFHPSHFSHNNLVI